MAVQVTCRICGKPVRGEWKSEQQGSRVQNVLYEYVTQESGGVNLLPHHVYVNGVGQGCKNRMEQREESSALPLPMEAAPPPRREVQVAGSNGVAQWEEKINGAVTAANSAFSMAMDMSGAAANMARDAAELKAEFSKLDEKWTAYAQAHQVITYETPEYSWSTSGRQHKMQEKLMHLLFLEEPVFIKGPAGSGKTKGWELACEMLGKPFRFISIGPMTTESRIYGFKNMATGEYEPTSLTFAAEEGGPILFDEVDRGNAGLNTLLNVPCEANNRFIAFPHRTIEKVKGYVPGCTANTFGLGADAIYVGANQQDGAFLDRFSVIEWDYDWDFVNELAGDEKWTAYVQALYVSASTYGGGKGLPVVIGPRAAIQGAKLIRAGFSWQEAAEMRIWGRVSSDMRRQIEVSVRMEHYNG